MSDDDQVRRLLADARHDEPMPDDVAARLDGVLADLRDEKRPTPTSDLAAAHQRRRRVRAWVLAAAAVVVVGVGANQVDWSGISMSGADSADAGAGSATSAQEESADRDDAASVAPEAASAPADGGAAWRWARLRLSSEGFGDEVADFRAGNQLHPLRSQDKFETTDGELASDGAAFAAVCGLGRVGPGRRVPVRYDGDRAWLVFRPVQGDTQVVDLYLCGLEAPTRSITLPAR
ncbi:hypothetical protein [Nocardioides caricicola]|uniref:Uncharacterized protein n=1 Tax=Nocardioides caricicola TaxID=634770 RepID=A0ABW0MXC4_9ACTN